MESVIILLVLAVGGWASPAYQTLSLKNDGSYQFAYGTGDETGSHSRSESKGPDGLVVGKYSYEDPTGDLRVVNYQAGDFGYVAKGAVGVAGAPDSQFPAEPLDVADEAMDNQEPTKDDEQKDDDKQEDNPTSDKVTANDAKSMALLNSPADDPPEGFPIGFFDYRVFPGPRRLPEPIKSDDADEESKKDESKEEKKATADKEKEKEKTKVVPAHSPFEHFSALSPYPGFHPHTWTAPLAHSADTQHPVYVYSYQVPQAHGYYYQY